MPDDVEQPPGTLYVIATPIGNLEDLSPRARRILGEVVLIAAEDTRVTRRLLSHAGISTPLTSYHAHSPERKAESILARVIAGEDVALVSDAGTPGISDPGGTLVALACAAGVAVVPVPGPSAVLAALAASGLDPSRFIFEGFLPRTAGDRRKRLLGLAGLPHTLVFFEAPGRVAATLASLRQALGDREAVVARELTKRFETFRRGPLSTLEERFRADPQRGEHVILVAGADEPSRVDAGDSRGRLEELLAAGVSVRDAARTVAAESGRPRKAVYEEALAVEAARS